MCMEKRLGDAEDHGDREEYMWRHDESRNDEVMYPSSQMESTGNKRGELEEVVKKGRRVPQTTS